LLEFLKEKASVMLGWIKSISFENGEIPLFNDSANKIAPTTNQLFEYALKLDINFQFSIFNFQLKESGYRKIKKENYECIIDVGEIGSSYIPGHAHADTFNFELYIKNKPFIVDTGISTYNIGKIRNYERSTNAHNTVEINNENSSEVWGGFRVADRANIIELIEDIDYIKATHNGYSKQFGILHTREWKFEKDKIIIKDILNKEANGVARLHFHPDIVEDEIKEKIIFNSKFSILNYNYAPEFNEKINALVLEISFEKKLDLEIKI
jgi:uncharacterized heparinase superfamily protein